MDIARPVIMSPSELAEIATQLAAAGRVDDLPAGPGRRWALLARTDRYDSWIIAWPPGTGLPMHHHRGSAAAIRVVRGRLHERHVQDDGIAARWLDDRRTVTLPDDHVHEVANLDCEEAVSVHVYSPPGSRPDFLTDWRRPAFASRKDSA